jgi:uncharacterized protein YjiS (DUF1127 family)
MRALIADPADPTPSALACVVARLVRVRLAIRARRDRSAQRREFNQLNRQALRDLGVDRSEFDSYMAELDGVQPTTRRRIARAR